jgi:hypothetical protein
MSSANTGIRLLDFQFLTLSFQPISQLRRVGEDGTPPTSGEPMDGKAALGLPALHGALGAPEKCGDFLPGIETFARCWVWIGCHKGK